MFRDFKLEKNPVARVQKDDSDKFAWTAVICLSFCGCTVLGHQGDT